MDKVEGGTPQGNRSLCWTCRYAKNTIGLNLQQNTVCMYSLHSPVQVMWPISQCSVYDDKRVPSYYQMEQIAWSIQTRSRGPAGFAGNMNEVVITPPNRNNNNQPVPQTGEFKIEREK